MGHQVTSAEDLVDQTLGLCLTIIRAGTDGTGKYGRLVLVQDEHKNVDCVHDDLSFGCGNGHFEVDVEMDVRDTARELRQ